MSFSTARDMETDIVAGLEYGADDYITKPFSLMVLRKNPGASQADGKGPGKGISAAALCFSLRLHGIFYKESRPVELSKTGTADFVFACFNPGQIITKERLLEWV